MEISRRRALESASVTAAVALTGCIGESTSVSDNSETISIREVESSVSAAVFQWGIDKGVWSSRNIELDFETVPYGRYNRQLVTNESDIGAPATVAQMEFMTDGEPLTFIGPQQNMFNRMFVQADDSSIETFTVRRDWLEENRETTEQFLEGWAKALSLFRSNAETALSEFGKAAGISDPNEAAVVTELMDTDTIFGPPFYEESLADSHWSFFELLADREVLDLPDRGAAITTVDAFDQD